jgi:methionine synthase II (cobalamin-independent)
MVIENQFNGRGLSTLIGSLPVADYRQALDLILDYTPDIPLWPQLPSNPKEGMMNQFIDGIPGIIDAENRTLFDLSGDNFESEMLSFYEEYLACLDDPSLLLTSRFSVSKERARGIYDLKEICSGKKITAVKGQITGPFTLLTGISDENHKLGYYDAQFREIAVKGLAMKGGWQAEFLKSLGAPVIIFIDEPALAGLGSSAFISISKEDIGQDLSEVISGIQQSGGFAGVHVCANTDWNFLLSVAIDVLSFDSYGFFDRLITCKQQLLSFLDRGGNIAWGIIPTSDEKTIEQQDCESLVALWEKQAGMLEDGNFDKSAILARSLITPSCGTGALSLNAALKVLSLTKEVSAALRERYQK